MAATLGAPILHDKLFFFGDYQGVKQVIGVTRISTMPTMAMRQGIFTGVSKIYDPTTTQTVAGKFVRQEFPNDVINMPFDPAAEALLARFPVPTNSAGRRITTRGRRMTRIIRISLMFAWMERCRNRDRAFGRYSYYNEVELPVAPLPDGSGLITGSVLGTGGVVGLSNVLGQQAVFNETHTFSPRLLNDLAVGYTRRGNTIVGPTLGTTASSALGIPGIPTNAAFNNALPLFTLTGIQQLGPSASTFSQYQTAVWQMVDTVNCTHGAACDQGGDGFSLVSAEYGVSAESDGLVCVYYDGHESAGRDEQRQFGCELSAGAGGYVSRSICRRARFGRAT